MPSLIFGYEFDIFISYRHNDNRSGWVTDFVNVLQEELASTIKESLTIYFDKNPHDGLLETHNVDKSLEGKLKCLLFIPIISQTYCDTKSFAWQHEFVAFNKLAKEDQFGRDIKLRNGNVASRILPIKIHDLDAEDKATIENEIGGILRSIEFIYNAPGVSRPLTINDNPEKNLNKTLYRDQINKVARSVKDLIHSLQHPIVENKTVKPSISINEPSKRSWVPKTIAGILTLGIVLFSIFYFTGWGTKPDVTIDKSIGVLPFTDISEAHDQGYFTDGMMVEIMDHLYKIENLRVIPRTSMLAYKDSPKPLKEIASELRVATLLEGSVRKVGTRIKISVQLIDGENETRLWQQTYEHDIADVFSVQSNVAQNVAASLQATITPEVKLRIESIPTANQNAYDHFLKGKDQSAQFWNTFDLSHIDQAIGFYRKAIDLDAKFSNAYTGLGQAYWILAHFDPGQSMEYWRHSKEYIEKAITLDPNNGWAYAELGLVQSLWDWDKEAAMKSFRKGIALNPGNLESHNNFFYFFLRAENCEEAEKELQIMRTIDKSFARPGHDVLVMMCKLDSNPPKGVDEKELESSMDYQMMKGNYKTVIEREATIKTAFYFYSGEAYALMGNAPKAYEVIRQMNELSKRQYVSKCPIAAIYMGLGEEEKAYQLLEEALKERDYMVHGIIPVSVTFRKKRTDTRMRAFIDRTWIPQKE